MNKKNLVDAIVDRHGTNRRETNIIVDAVLEEIAQALIRRESVSVTNFGTFTTVDRATRSARNPQTGETIQVPARPAVVFRPGPRLVEHVRGEKTAPDGDKVIGKLPRTRVANDDGA